MSCAEKPLQVTPPERCFGKGSARGIPIRQCVSGVTEDLGSAYTSKMNVVMHWNVITYPVRWKRLCSFGWPHLPAWQKS